VDVDLHATAAIVFDSTQFLCRKHGLTAYDSGDLEIAMRGNYALATVDEELRRAAINERVPVL
jgi:rRNA-processing protein FCF1